MTVAILSLLALNCLWKFYVDHASRYIVSYVGVYHQPLLAILSRKRWWEYLLPMPELNGGVWATTGILTVYGLELLLGSAPRAYYLVTSLVIATAFFVSWRVYRSLLLSSLIGLSFALTTYDYVSYALSGGVITPLVVTFAMLFAYSQYRLFLGGGNGLKWGFFFLALALYALSYEGWLDFVVGQWILYPVVVYAFYRQRDRGRAKMAVAILMATSLAAAAYVLVKVSTSYLTLHSPGLEADTVFNYRGRYLLIGVEDVIANVITLFFTAITTYLPPQVFNFSLSSWYFGDKQIVALQNGYHPTHTQLVAYSHLFLWRFYAGIAIALFGVIYVRVIRRLVENPTPSMLSIFTFMTASLIGSPTHAMVKMRPMHATPLLGYQVYLAVVGVTFLMCYGVHYLNSTMQSRRWLPLIVALFCLNLFFCALARPSLLSHMSVLSGLGPYPVP